MYKLSIDLLYELGACDNGIAWFKNVFGYNEYSIQECMEILSKKDIKPEYHDICWLIENCKFLQTKEMLEYLISLNPGYHAIYAVFNYCEYYRTKSVIKFFLNLNIEYSTIHYLMRYFKCFRNKKSINRYVELNPSSTSIRQLHYQLSITNKRLASYLLSRVNSLNNIV